MPKNWARNSTVTPFEDRGAVLVGGGADGEDEARDTRGGSFRFCSATRSAVGSVALDEAVEKATTIAS